jgi:hypothetical protein
MNRTTRGPKMDRDKLFGGVDAVRLRNQAFHVIDRTQDEPEHQIQAIGLALVCACSGVGLDVKEILTACERIRTVQDGPYVGTYRAIEDYAKHEIGRL